MAIYYGYLDSDERELMIESEKLENEISRLETMYEMLNLKLKQMESDIHLKVLTESGTYDDYAELMVEAEAAVNEEKKGVMTNLWEKIKQFFRNMGSAISGLFKGNPDEDIKVDAAELADVEARAKAASGFTSGIKNIISGVGSGNWDQALEGVKQLATSPLIIGVAATGAAVGTYKVLKRKVADGHCQAIAGAINAISDLIDKITSTIGNSAVGKAFSGTVDKIKGYLNDWKTKLTEVKNKITGWVRGKISGDTSDDNSTGKSDGSSGSNNNKNGSNGKPVTAKDVKPSAAEIKCKDGNTYKLTDRGTIGSIINTKTGRPVSGISSNDYPEEVKNKMEELSKQFKEYQGRTDREAGVVGKDPSKGLTYKFSKNSGIMTVIDNKGNKTEYKARPDGAGNFTFGTEGEAIPANIRHKALVKYTEKMSGTKFKDDGGDKNIPASERIDELREKKAKRDAKEQNNLNKEQDDKIRKARLESTTMDASSILDESKMKHLGKSLITKLKNFKLAKADISRYKFKRVDNGLNRGYNYTLIVDGKSIPVTGETDIDCKSITNKYNIKMNQSEENNLRCAFSMLKSMEDESEKKISKMKEEFDKNNLSYTKESYDDNLYYESYEIDGFTVTESEDEIIFYSMESEDEIDIDHSIFGITDYVESTLDEIIYEDRYDQEIYDVACKFNEL